MKNKGQSIIEFAIITAVIALGGIFAFTMLGGNIHEMFSSSVEKQKNFDPFDAKNQTTKTTTSDKDDGSKEIVETKIIGDYSVDMLADGSAVMNVDGKTITLSAASFDSMNTIMQTSGSEGSLIDIVGYMLKTHAAEYPDSEVPIEISFGDGKRFTDPVGDGTYYNSFISTASVNTVSVKVKDHLIILSNDHDVNITDGVDNETQEMGVNRIEGTIKPDGITFDATVTSENPSLNNQSFSAVVSQTGDGFTFVDNDLTYFEEFNADYTGGHLETGGKWELNFVAGNGT